MKEKSIFKMVLGGYGNMLLAGIFCFIVSMSVMVFNFPLWITNLILLVLTIPLFCALLYSPIWMEGDRNRNMVQFGHLEYDKYKGLKIGLFLAIPFLLENLFLTLSKFGVIPDIFVLYRLLNMHLWPLISSLNPGTSIAELPIWGLILCWLSSFYPTVVAVIGYFLGYKGISVVEKLIYKNKPRPKKKRRY